MPSNDNQMVISRLIGTWRLQSFYIKTANGKVTYPFGGDAVGYYIFSESGYMSVMFMGAHRPKLTGEDVLALSNEDKAAIAEAYISYCGKYEIRGDKLFVYPEVSFIPDWIGVDQERLFELTDNTLTLSTTSMLLQGMQQTAHLVWERI